MNSIVHFIFKTRTGKNLYNKFMGFGASIVILGACFKITHFPGGGVVITLGLVIEALLFAIGALEPLPYDDDEHDDNHNHKNDNFDRNMGSLTANDNNYPIATQPLPTQINVPQNINNNIVDPSMFQQKQANYLIETSIVAKIDALMQEAKIDNTLLTNFEQSISSFVGNVQKFSEAVESSDLQKPYFQEMEQALQKMQQFNEHLDFQLELTANQSQVSNDLLENYNIALAHQTEIKTELLNLHNNIVSLNNIYGGMLSNISR